MNSTAHSVVVYTEHALYRNLRYSILITSGDDRGFFVSLDIILLKTYKLRMVVIKCCWRCNALSCSLWMTFWDYIWSRYCTICVIQHSICICVAYPPSFSRCTRQYWSTCEMGCVQASGVLVIWWVCWWCEWTHSLLLLSFHSLTTTLNSLRKESHYRAGQSRLQVSIKRALLIQYYIC